jgi:hypothetical protein
MKLDPLHVAAGVGVLAAAGLAYAATRTAGPVSMPVFTELREGPLMEHLVTREQLGTAPAKARHHYPGQVAPAISAIVSKGFAPLYCLPDPQAAALPAEQAW